MFRSVAFAVVALAVLLPAHAIAQPALPGSFHVVEMKAEKGKAVWSEVKYVAQQKEEERVVVVNGMNVKQKVTVTVYVPVLATIGVELKKLKATDGTGKEIDTEKLAGLLKDETPVVIVSGPVVEKHRKLFKDSTVFIELPAPELPKGLPVPVPPVATDPTGKPPVAPPEGEKSGL